VPFSLVFIPAISRLRSLNVSWRLVPLPASLSISCASVSPNPFMVSANFVSPRVNDVWFEGLKSLGEGLVCVRKNFQSESWSFLFMFCGLFGFLFARWALLECVLWCVSAWFVVRFNVVWRDVCAC